MIKFRYFRYSREPVVRLAADYEGLIPRGFKHGEPDVVRRTIAHAEFSYRNKYKLAHAYMRLDPDGNNGPEIGFSLAIPFLFCLFVSFYCPFVRNLRYERRIGVRFFDNSVHLDTFSVEGDWSSDWPWWKKGVSFNYVDFLLGRQAYSRQILGGSFRSMHVPAAHGFPEGDYTTRVQVCIDTWKRPRWFKAKRILRTETDVIGASVPYGKDNAVSQCLSHHDADVDRALKDVPYCLTFTTPAIKSFIAYVQGRRGN